MVCPFLSLFFFTEFFGPLTFGEALHHTHHHFGPTGGAAVLAMITHGSNARPCWEKICSELQSRTFVILQHPSFQFAAAENVVGEKFNAAAHGDAFMRSCPPLFGFRRGAKK